MSLKAKHNLKFLKLLIFISIIACQEAKEVVSFPEDQLTFNSSAVNTLESVVLRDGSFDNAIDNSSCISIKLPVDVVVNGQSLSITSDEDISIVEDILNEHEFDYDTIRLSYPLQIINADHSESTVDNINELDAIRSECQENGVDRDIECIDFIYPFSVSRYDQLNQLASNATLNSDKEVFELLSSLDEAQIVSFNYPISVAPFDGEILAINNNDELLNAIENNSITCDEADILYYQNLSETVFQTGTLKVSLTDAPFPIGLLDEANLVISKVLIKPINEDTLLTLSEEVFELNLLDLNNGITAQLVDLQIPEGTYDQIRLIIDSSTVLLVNGTLYDLKVPSESIKVNINPGVAIVRESSVELLLDFDVSRSFVIQGNPDTPAGIKGFLFKPTIKAANLTETGTLFGTVTDEADAALSGVQLSVYAADTLNTTTFTTETGNYKILGLVPGTYEVVAELADYVTVNESDIEILELEETELNFKLQLE